MTSKADYSVRVALSVVLLSAAAAPERAARTSRPT